MIHPTKKKDCCGCSACEQVCPVSCIRMQEDAEGFSYPVADTETCIDCGLCEKVCPFIHPGMSRRPERVYAVKNRREEVRRESSSGGVFALLAGRTLEEGGVVFGACFDDRWEVVHGHAVDENGVERFYGSKYVQSRIGNAYREAERFLKEGRPVLFSGTPCQVAGLKRFLRKEYPNLLAVDFICHGVPSPLVWRSYLNELLSRKLHRPVASVRSIGFRDKHRGWKLYGLRIVCNSGKTSGLIRLPLYLDAYLRGFLSDLYLRPACYACAVRGLKSGSDVTLGDYWGCRRSFPDFDDDRGVSAVLLHTEKGRTYFESLPADKRLSAYEDVLRKNPALEESSEQPSGRQTFFDSFLRIGVIASVRKLTGMTVRERIKTDLYLFLRRVRFYGKGRL